MEKTAKEIIEMLKGHEEALGDDYITLIEDVTDSVKQTADMSKFVSVDDFNKVKSDYNDLKAKYIQRFESGDVSKPPVVEEKPKEEEKPITIEDLFKKE